MAKFIKAHQHGKEILINIELVTTVSYRKEDPDHTRIGFVGEEGLVMIDEPMHLIEKVLPR